MKFWRTLRLLLTALAVVGITMAPLVAPAVASTMPAVAATAMADDMPCCPHVKPVMPDCAKACPLMAVCMAKYPQTVPAGTAALYAPLQLAGVILAGDDVLSAGLAEGPKTSSSLGSYPA